MYPAGAFHQTDGGRLAALVGRRGLAVIIAAGAPPRVAHAPVLVSDDRVRFHLSRANRLCAAFEENPLALAVVTGPDAYVSPDWYAAADQVPTWNYVSAEMEGPVRRLDRRETERLLDDLAGHFESGLAPKPPWTRGKMTPARFETMLGAIVGFEIIVERFEGVTKLSQNKPDSERERVAAALAERPDEGSRTIAALMREQSPID